MKQSDSQKVPITWKLIFNLLLFKDEELKYSKKAKFWLSILLWTDVAGLILLIWGLIIFYVQLFELIIFMKNLLNL